MMIPPLNVLISVEYIPPSIPTLCNPKYTMFHFGVDSHSFTKEPQHDFTSLASPKGEMESPFRWNRFLKSPRSSTLCFGEPTLAKLNQEPTLAKLNQVKPLCVTESYVTKSSSIWYTQQLISAAHLNFVLNYNLVTTPSSSIDLTFNQFLTRTQCNMLARMGSISIWRIGIILLKVGRILTATPT